MSGSVSIELIEKRNSHGEVGVGKELDRFGLRGISKEDGDVFLDGAFFEQIGEDLGALGVLTDDDAGRVQVVIKGTAFAQELRREDQILGAQHVAGLQGIADGNGRFDDHGSVGIDGYDVPDDGFNGFGIEVVGVRIIVGGCGNNDVVGTFVGFFSIERCP